MRPDFRLEPGYRFRLYPIMAKVLGPDFVNAENAFRRARFIAEIGRGSASETSLVDLVRSILPAIHQWRPSSLGSQSVDTKCALAEARD